MSSRNIFTRSLVFNKGERAGEVSQYFLCPTCVTPSVFLQYLPAQSLCIKVEIKCLPRVGRVCQYLALLTDAAMLSFCNNITYKWTSSAILKEKYFSFQMFSFANVERERERESEFSPLS